MDVDPIGFSLAVQALSDEMSWLAPDDAKSLNWANNGRSKPTAEIKVLEAKPYLRLEQITSNGSVRMLVLCNTDQLTVVAGVFADYSSMQMPVPGKERSYLVAQGREHLSGPMLTTDFSIEDGGFFLQRQAPKFLIRSLLQSDKISIRFDVGRDFWYGNELDLLPIQDSISRFLDGC
jgi:hypothetical protein